MNLQNDLNNNKQTKQPIMSMTEVVHHQRRVTRLNRACIICGSKAIGINFGVPTCAPCKAFFRRNARRKEILDSSCYHPNKNTSKEKHINLNDKTIRYLQIRRCSSCRLRRCFEVGMKEELVRTDEENQRHKQLVMINRKQRESLKKKQEEEHLTICQFNGNNSGLLNENDWRHLSNIVYAYDTCCLKTFIEQRANIFIDETSLKERTMERYSIIPMSVTISILSFIRALPTFHSISRTVQSFLCKNNLRRLIPLNIYELNQSCFSEPSQVAAFKSCLEFMFGPELYKQYAHTQELAQISIIADPIVTRLWLITLFFSTPLGSYYDPQSSIIKIKKQTLFINIQNAYITLLWKYLLHRHGFMESVRIYSNLVHVFLHMLRVGFEINIRFRTQQELIVAHKTLDQLATLDINHD